MQVVAQESLDAAEISPTDWEKLTDPTRMFNSFEFGPAWWFHLPMFLIGVSWAIRLRKANFFAAANPALENGGLYNYSKFAAQNHFPPINLPKTCLLNSEENIDSIFDRVRKQGILFPLIIKPDMGERGKGVKLIRKWEELETYLAEQPKDAYMIQEFIGKRQEYGVFFFKNPVTGEFSISSLTRKISLQVIGDGTSSIIELIQNHPRASRYQNLFQLDNPNSIPSRNEIVKLSSLGNHCKGAVFLDYSTYITTEMTAAFERIFVTVEGINYGRLDVKVDDLNELSDPGQVIILEVNGANAEPIHMYSPEKSYYESLQILSCYFQCMAKMAKLNLTGNRKKYKESDTWRNYLTYRKK